MQYASKRRLVVVSMLGVIAISSSATAGETENDTVVVNTTDGVASGALAAARYSADHVQFIGCENGIGLTSAQAQCWAEDAAGHYLECTTSNASMVAASRAINATSFVVFAANLHDGDCTALIVSASSLTMH